MEGRIFNIQKFCTDDGPGIRTTVFLKGCPLKCVWCHNPESQSAEPEIMFHADKCTRCGKCEGVTAQSESFVCINGAKEICGKNASVDYVVDEVLKDKCFYDNSGGGVTLSGGEPLYQYDFSLSLLKKFKKYKLHTAIETCGFASPTKIREIANYTDLFLFDFKETNSALHKSFTGFGNEPILSNLELLSNMKKQIVLRCPVIPGCNDRPEHFNGICNIANALEGIIGVEIEPYHSLGENKYFSLGRATHTFKVPTEGQKAEWLEAVSAGCVKSVNFA